MELAKARIQKLAGLNWKKAAHWAALALVLALAVTICISTSHASGMRKKYASSRQAVGDALYGTVTMMLLEYEGASYAGADVDGSILPSMKQYYGQAQALNVAMAEAFGDRYAVLGGELILQINQAFSEYDGALRAGRSTKDADALMQAALEKLRDALNAHFDPQGKLL